MGEFLNGLELALALLAVVLVAAVVATVVRRRTIERRGDLAMCALRLPSEPRWHTGLLRLSATYLEWYPLFGVTAKARYRWPREFIDVGSPHTSGDGSPAALPGVGPGVRVPITVRGHESVQAEMVVARGMYAALQAWTEAAPPSDWRVEG